MSCSGTSPTFMGIESSLPFSQKPFTEPRVYLLWFVYGWIRVEIWKGNSADPPEVSDFLSPLRKYRSSKAHWACNTFTLILSNSVFTNTPECEFFKRR